MVTAVTRGDQAGGMAALHRCGLWTAAIRTGTRPSLVTAVVAAAWPVTGTAGDLAALVTRAETLLVAAANTAANAPAAPPAGRLPAETPTLPGPAPTSGAASAAPAGRPAGDDMWTAAGLVEGAGTVSRRASAILRTADVGHDGPPSPSGSPTKPLRPPSPRSPKHSPSSPAAPSPSTARPAADPVALCVPLGLTGSPPPAASSVGSRPRLRRRCRRLGWGSDPKPGPDPGRACG
jgi:hypothetical protein